MAILLYCCILLTTVTQSASTKQYQRVAHNAAAFNALKASSACLLFGLLCIGHFTFHLSTMLYGLGYGALMCLSMYAGFRALGLGPMSLTSLIVSFSVVLPLLYGLAFCHEELSLFKGLGLAALVVALIAANVGKGHASQQKTDYPKWIFFILLTFLSNGFCSVLQKQHQLLYPGLYLSEFMLFAMLVCMIVFLAIAAVQIKPNQLRALRGKRYGLLSGITNGLANYCTLALSGMENASVLFPAISAGTILLSLLCGMVIFRERLRAPHWLALGAGILAVVFLKL
ncbi:MAG: EamA family transporter [Clostridia bacterium]|nr:EamA family transporter [Clostridia bacterium]